MRTRATITRIDQLPLITTPNELEAAGMGSARAIRSMCENGTIKAVKVGKLWKINTAEALKFFGLV